MFGTALGVTASTTRLVREKYAEFAPFQPDIPGRCLENRYTNDASAFLDIGGARIHYRDEGDATGPTLVQWGAEDDWLPVELGERFVKEIPDATMKTYPGVGHIPMEEAPAETAADAAAFLGVE